jgi:hypothetical protein
MGKQCHHHPKTVLRLPDLDQPKSAVLDSLSSAYAQRGYRHAMDEFIEWYCAEAAITKIEDASEMTTPVPLLTSSRSCPWPFPWPVHPPACPGNGSVA